MKNLTKQYGITLIALVIAIIILLTLAGAAINLVMGSNGVIEKSANAVTKYKEQAELEALELIQASLMLDVNRDGDRL